MAKKVIIQDPAPLHTSPQNFFDRGDFDILIWRHGYNVIIEKALRCPCKSKGGDNLSNCQNCGGSGWVFINSVQTKAILTSQNSTTNFKDWSEVNIGNVNITTRDIDKLAFMDRITALDGESIHTQTAYPVLYNNVLFAFLDYAPKAVQEVFLFNKQNEKLLLLQNSVDYNIVENKIILDSKFIVGGVPVMNETTISIRYIHAPQYHVIDVKRDVMVSPTYESQGRKLAQMPISAQGRRAHYVLDRQNYKGDLIFDNSYLLPCNRAEDEKCLNNPI